MTTFTTSTDNLSTSRQVQFTVEGVVSLAWKKAQMINLRSEPDAQEQNFARQHLLMIMDSISAQARITRAMYRHEITTVASQAEYTLSADIMDVVGNGTYRATSDGYDTPLRQISRDDYIRLGDKDAEGVPVLYFSEKGNRVVINVWPVPEIDDAIITVQAAKWLYDVTAGPQTIDLERYFAPYLVTALAYEIATANSKPLDFCGSLKKEAASALPNLLGYSKQRGGGRLVLRHRTPWSR